MTLLRIAMWSGPRNLSTAMMYAFAARDDCAVWDEPFYAAYLAATGIVHPLRDQIIAAHESDPDRIAATCKGPVSQHQSLFYQKHMTQHMILQFDRRWMRLCQNVFLIRHPARVVASYASKRQGATLDDIGFRQQASLFDEVATWTGSLPSVIDSDDIRVAPETMLRRLCLAINVAFTRKMLKWPAAGGPLPPLGGTYAALADQALPSYDKLAAHKL